MSCERYNWFYLIGVALFLLSLFAHKDISGLKISSEGITCSKDKCTKCHRPEGSSQSIISMVVTGSSPFNVRYSNEATNHCSKSNGFQISSQRMCQNSEKHKTWISQVKWAIIQYEKGKQQPQVNIEYAVNDKILKFGDLFLNIIVFLALIGLWILFCCDDFSGHQAPFPQIGVAMAGIILRYICPDFGFQKSYLLGEAPIVIILSLRTYKETQNIALYFLLPVFLVLQFILFSSTWFIYLLIILGFAGVFYCFNLQPDAYSSKTGIIFLVLLIGFVLTITKSLFAQKSYIIYLCRAWKICNYHLMIFINKLVDLMTKRPSQANSSRPLSLQMGNI